MMNKIIREHYPASKLPNDLREGIDPSSNVTVTVVTEDAPSHSVMTLDEIFAARRPPYRTAEEIDEEIRQSRRDWDD
jgi:hypothetical protein